MNMDSQLPDIGQVVEVRQLPLQVVSICATLVGKNATTSVEALSGKRW